MVLDVEQWNFEMEGYIKKYFKTKINQLNKKYIEKFKIHYIDV